jgi:hypothetical protein
MSALYVVFGGRAILRIEYVALADLKRHPRNPKDHDLGAISRSVNRFGFTAPILIDERTGYLAAGHGRIDTLAQLKAQGKEPPANVQLADFDGDWLVPVVRGVAFNSDAEIEAYLVADNRLTILGGWNEPELAELLQDLAAQDTALLEATGYDGDDLQALLDELGGAYDEAGAGANDAPRVTLADRFIVPPFSVLDARAGYWQERKRRWLAMGLKGALGRGGDTLANGRAAAVIGGAPLPLDRAANGRGLARTFGQDLMRGEHVVGGGGAVAIRGHEWQQRVLGKVQAASESSGTSIMDPVLCELAYRWFCPAGGLIVNPTAGESVYGIVAGVLGYHYEGVEIRAEQIEANEAQALEIGVSETVRWIHGDGQYVADLVSGAADFVMCCPPYYDLEVYSDDPRDISTIDEYADFLAVYRRIISGAVQALKPDRFACFVVGDIRDKRGHYRNFVSDTISAFLDARCSLYNEAILVTAVGSLPVRAGRVFSASRKLGKTHQNVLIFVKGDWRKAVAACGEVEVTIPDDAIDPDDAT